ncbi:MAG: VWA domain-containing protein [Bryobacteraceae bacterium]
MKTARSKLAQCGRPARYAAVLPFLFFPLLAQTGGAGAQGTSSLKLKAESRLVLVDAVVTGKKDEPIHGLEAKDFHVFEDGKEQTITAFQTHTGPAVPGMSQRQYFVLLFDGGANDDQKWIQQAASKFIADNAGPNRLMMVANYNSGCMTIVAQFTADFGELHRGLDKPNLSRCGYVPDPSGGVRAGSYSQLARDLAHVPGHKIVALFAGQSMPQPSAFDHWPRSPVQLPCSGGEENVGPLSDPKWMPLDFRKADISVYPVQGQIGAISPCWALKLAAATGGRAMYRGNDVLGVFQELAREQDESYTLGYVPAESPEGSCHSLKVTVDRSDVKVGGRNLYCNVREVSLPPANPTEVELENLAASQHAGNTAASASLPSFYEAGGAARVNLALEIPAPVLNPTEAHGKLRASMDVLGLAYNLGGGVAARFGDTVRFDFDNRQQFDDFLRHPLRYEHQFEIAPGNYRFKLVFRTAKDRFGVVETPLAVDPVDAAQLSMSDIAISHDVQPISQEAAQEELDQGNNPLIFRGYRITVAGSDVVPRTGTAEAYFEIYEPPATGGGVVQLTMRLRLLDAQSNEQKSDSGDVDLSALAKSGNRAIPVVLKLPVANLPPGTYRAELTVKDSAGGETGRSVQFRTE